MILIGFRNTFKRFITKRFSSLLCNNSMLGIVHTLTIQICHTKDKNRRKNWFCLDKIFCEEIKAEGEKTIRHAIFK